jgi:hypothetical protein
MTASERSGRSRVDHGGDMTHRIATAVAALTVAAATASIGTSGAGGAVPAAPTHVPVEYHAPNIPGTSPAGVHAGTVAKQWTSRNWSGYAIAGTKKAKVKFTSVSGSWTVPTVSASNHAGSSQYSASWVGIDGFLPHDRHLIQAGTEEDWRGDAPSYQAWWEILPAPETPITTVTVNPGDTMEVAITRGNPDWVITVTDTTTGESFTTNQAYRGPLSSAEWIQEAPTVGGRIANLADDSTFAFDLATANGVNPGLVSSEAGTMVNNGGTAISTPSVPDADTDGFAVAHGGVAPTPLSS